MMALPGPILDIIEKMAEKYPDDIKAGAAEAYKKIKGLKSKDLDDWIELLVLNAIQESIYDFRHQKNRRIRKDAGVYTPGTKVFQGSPSADRVAENIYQYCIAGMTLGEIYGEQLFDIGMAEKERAEGHQFNHRLCLELEKHVKPGQRVREAVTSKQLQKIFRNIKGSMDTTAVPVKKSGKKVARKTVKSNVAE